MIASDFPGQGARDERPAHLPRQFGSNASFHAGALPGMLLDTHVRHFCVSYAVELTC